MRPKNSIPRTQPTNAGDTVTLNVTGPISPRSSEKGGTWVFSPAPLDSAGNNLIGTIDDKSIDLDGRNS